MKPLLVTFLICITLYVFQSSCHARVRQKNYRECKTYEDTISTPKFNISESDLEYGKNEVRRLLRDRPQMSQLVKEGDPIWTMAARAFAGEYSNARLKWMPQEKFSDKNMDSFHNWGTPVPEIFVNGHTIEGKQRSAQECWRDTFFELFCLSRYKENLVIRSEALERKCSRNEYIRKSAKLQYLAHLQTYAFYKNTWANIMGPGKPTTAIDWYKLVAQQTFEQWYSGWVKKEGPQGYPYSYFGPKYDLLMINKQYRPQKPTISKNLVQKAVCQNKSWTPLSVDGKIGPSRQKASIIYSP